MKPSQGGEFLIIPAGFGSHDCDRSILVHAEGGSYLAFSKDVDFLALEDLPIHIGCEDAHFRSGIIVVGTHEVLIAR